MRIEKEIYIGFNDHKPNKRSLELDNVLFF